jgi:hypothetical protein
LDCKKCAHFMRCKNMQKTLLPRHVSRRLTFLKAKKIDLYLR